MTTRTNDLPLTFSVEDGADRLGVKVDWYKRQLCDRKLPGHKMGRFWRLTEADLAAALRITARPARVVPSDPDGLTPESRRRLNRRRG